jgi:hypothetical protein
MPRGAVSVIPGAFALGLAACATPTNNNHHEPPPDAPGPHSDGGHHDDGGTMTTDAPSHQQSDGGTVTGQPMTCPGPGTPKQNGGSCGSERWNIKTGTDSGAASISLVPQPNTIAALVALPAAGGGSSREHPTETTVWELKNVVLTELKSESVSDYHLVISDGTHTMIAEIPYMGCATGSAWSCFISRARSEVDARFNVSGSPQYPSQTITLRGVGFFDYAHGQNGVAPNAIELHPILEICFGQDCVPD